MHHHHHHNHHNHHIKVVSFNQADNDDSKQFVPFYTCTQTASFKEFGTLVKLEAHVSVFCHLNSFFCIMT